MNSPLDDTLREALTMRYLEALEEGQFEEVQNLLKQAELDPLLCELFSEIDEALFAESEAQDQNAPHVWSLAFTEMSQQETRRTETYAKHKQDSFAVAEPEVPKPLSLLTPEWQQRVQWGVGVLGVLAVMVWFGLADSLVMPEDQKQALWTLKACRATLPKASSQTWLDQVHHQPQKMLAMLKAGTAYEDLSTLRHHQRLRDAVSRPLPTKLTPTQRTLRARLYLRLARFHQKNYQMALSFHQEISDRRLKRAKTLRLGRYFHYYRGRLQCLKGKRKAGSRSLHKALQTSQPHRANRIKAWLVACQTPSLPSKELGQKLASLDFSKDPEGRAEWLLLHHLHQLKPKPPRSPQRTLRAKLYAKVAAGTAANWPDHILRQPVDQEKIEENGIKAKLEYFDPALYLMMSHDYAQRATLLLKASPQDDRYAPYFLAEAARLRDRPGEAQQRWHHFVTHLPTKINGAYLYFSRHMSPASLRDEACFYQAKMLYHPYPQIARQLLYTLSIRGEAGKALAGLGQIQLNAHPEQGYEWLLAATRHARRWEGGLRRRYRLAAIESRSQTDKRGAQIISQLELFRYQTRSLYLWGSIGAFLMKENNQATLWLEHLHNKQTPYKIAGANEPLQFAWTTRAYVQAGRPGVANLFLSNNLKAYPSLTQLWRLLRVWRIDEGMDSVPRIKG